MWLDSLSYTELKLSGPSFSVPGLSVHFPGFLVNICSMKQIPARAGKGKPHGSILQTVISQCFLSCDQRWLCSRIKFLARKPLLAIEIKNKQTVQQLTWPEWWLQSSTAQFDFNDSKLPLHYCQGQWRRKVNGGKKGSVLTAWNCNTIQGKQHTWKILQCT